MMMMHRFKIHNSFLQHPKQKDWKPNITVTYSSTGTNDFDTNSKFLTTEFTKAIWNGYYQYHGWLSSNFKLIILKLNSYLTHLI